ncbi:MAG: hypothetical protein IT429_18320 [Gemmataceae bacterium]|nr:hypothetical protein [Gemmataceae bacterium]
MVRFTVRKAALAAAALVAVVSPARADQCCSPCGSADSACAPATRTVHVTECVPEYYQAKRTVHRTTYRHERYQAFRCQMVPEVREQTVTTYNRVCEMRPEVRRVCVSVPAVEERVVMRPHYTSQTVTTMVSRTVDRGHWECREVYSHRRAMRNRIGRLCGRYDDCCNPCPAPTKTVKCWVACPVTECVPVTTCRRVCEMRPTVVRVNTCRQEVREVAVNVAHWQCVPVQRVVRCTVLVPRMVPYEAVRCVPVCTAHEEVVTLCRMVTRVVARQIPCDLGSDCCAVACCGTGKVKSGLFSRRSRGHACCD